MHRTHKAGHTSGVTFALLVATGLLTGPTAHAQTLTLGQLTSTTLSGTGTLTDAGTTVAGTYAYGDGKTGTPLSAQNNYKYWASYGPSTANVNGGTIGSLYAYNASTTNVGGGAIGSLSTTGTSTVNVNGGTIGSLSTYNTSTTNVSGGGISNLFLTYGTSTANVSGGTVRSLYTQEASTTNVSGGSINFLSTLSASTANVTGGSFGFFEATDTSTANINGGSFNGGGTEGTATANITGGSFSGGLSTYDASTTNVSGGSFNSLVTTGTSTMDLFGTGLTETFGFSMPTYTQYTVTGTLTSGDPLAAIYYDYGGTLEFNGAPAVPEASSVVSLGLLLLLGLGGVIGSRRRRAGAAR